MKALLSAVLILILLATSPGFSQRRGHSSGRGSSVSRVRYSGSRHTESHGGNYAGSHGRSHKGGSYRNTRTNNHYGRHK